MCAVGGWGLMFGTKFQINTVFLTPSLISIWLQCCKRCKDDLLKSSAIPPSSQLQRRRGAKLSLLHVNRFWSKGEKKTFFEGVSIFVKATNFTPRIQIQPLDQVLSSTAANVCGSSRATALTGDTSDECSSFRTYGQRKGTLGFQLNYWQTDC